jgi:four helix bundle protein
MDNTTRKGFVGLAVYRLAEKLADEIWELVAGWNHLARDTVGKQIIRAADSVGANIAEGAGRGTYKDNRHFVDMARGSLCETIHWLRRSYQRRLLPEGQITRLKAVLDELSPRLNAYRNSLNRRSTPLAAAPRSNKNQITNNK